MANGVNKAILIGNVGEDAELRFTSGGTAVAKFSLATSESWTPAGAAEKKTETTWHNIVVWAKLAEFAGEWIKKGKQIYLEGKIKDASYEKDGKKVHRTEIVASEIRLLGGPREDRPATDHPERDSSADNPTNRTASNQPPVNPPTIADEDLPF